MRVECHFYEKVPVGEQFSYDTISIAGPAGRGVLATEYPPAVGDLLHLTDQDSKVSGTYRVIERAWLYSSWGSMNWPYGEPFQGEPLWLDVIVEKTDGPFRNEASVSDDEDDDGDGEAV